MVLVRGGWFWRDVVSLPRKREQYPPVRNWIDSYYIAKHEARAEDLVRFLNSELENNPEFDTTLHESCVVVHDSQGKYTILRDEANLPANGLSWLLANDFVKWMGFRIPTEAEWEKAARGPDDKRFYPWGDNEPEHNFANFGVGVKTFGCDAIVPVDTMPEGRSPYGLYHMSGNVREFVEDWNDIENMDYASWIKDGMVNPPSDGRFTKKTFKMTKGGRFGDHGRRLTIGYDSEEPIDQIFRCNGVRYALDVEVVKAMLAAAKNSDVSSTIEVITK